MIGFNHLGALGRLGNQMFQYAAIRGISAYKGYEFCIPPPQSSSDSSSLALQNIFALPSLKVFGLVRGPLVRESIFNYNHDLVETCPDNASLYGYFQTERYFTHISESIRADFNFEDSLKMKCANMIGSEGYISLHVRRGDYLDQQDDYPVCNIEYYSKALDLLDRNYPVLIFSDDIEWCMKQELFKNSRFKFSSGNPNHVDLCLMSQCKYHIIANSSFSWWGAWLAQSDSVIAPKVWFGDNGRLGNLNTCDIIPERWQKI